MGFFLNLSRIMMSIAIEQENLHKKSTFCTECHNAQKDRKTGRLSDFEKGICIKVHKKFKKSL